MKSLNDTANRLLLALGRAGADVSLEQKRFWSRSYGKMMTKYTVRTRDKATQRRERLLETYKLADVVVLLAELYEAEREEREP